MNEISLALMSPQPRTALEALARRWKAQGLAQAEVRARFHELLVAANEAGDEAGCDALADTLDLIVGWCAPERALY